jgi:hypothetical protein
LADSKDGIDNNHNGVVDEPGECWGMTKYMAYDKNASTINGTPQGAAEYYNYLQGKWRNGTSITYGLNGTGGSVSCDYMFPGTSDPTGWGTNRVPQPAWDETSAGNTPGDRRALASFGGVTFRPGDMITLDFAYVWARDTGNNLSSVQKLKTYMDTVTAFYIRNNLVDYACSKKYGPAGITEKESVELAVLYPNPANDLLHVKFGKELNDGSLEVLDIRGRSLIRKAICRQSQLTIATDQLPAGMYFLHIRSGSEIQSLKFVKR